jgi:hypothetical protein
MPAWPAKFNSGQAFAHERYASLFALQQLETV